MTGHDDFNRDIVHLMASLTTMLSSVAYNVGRKDLCVLIAHMPGYTIDQVSDFETMFLDLSRMQISYIDKVLHADLTTRN
jgi:hypothetical protein